MPTPFESFVNAELPKRIATNVDPLSVPEGMVPVTTGVGLLTEFKPYNQDGTVSAEAILTILSSLLIFNEVPIQLNSTIFKTFYPYVSNSLMVYLNGIRLSPGNSNDFYSIDSYTFCIPDYELDDNLIIDYKRAL